MTYSIISEEKMVQKEMTGIFSGKKFKTIADSVVNKWCIMIQMNSGLVGVGIHEDKDQALQAAINEAGNN